MPIMQITIKMKCEVWSNKDIMQYPQKLCVVCVSFFLCGEGELINQYFHLNNKFINEVNEVQKNVTLIF